MNSEELILANERCAAGLIESIYNSSESVEEVRKRYSELGECEKLVIANYVADQLGRERNDLDLEETGLQNAIDMWQMKKDNIL